MSFHRKHLPWLTVLSILLLLQSCDGPGKEGVPSKTSRRKAVTPPAIRILPLGHAPKALVDRTAEDLRKVFPDVRILPAEPMPVNAWYKTNKRWRADTLIQWMGKRAAPGEVYLGITSNDISFEKKGVALDFGIMGLGLERCHACVASNRRLKDKSQFPKIVIHELGHTAGLPHCSSPRCLMRSANGRDHTREIDAFCDKCRSVLLRNGWRI
jgi:archaemetzincin